MKKKKKNHKKQVASGVPPVKYQNKTPSGVLTPVHLKGKVSSPWYLEKELLERAM